MVKDRTALRCAGEGECDETRLAEPPSLQVWDRHSQPVHSMISIFTLVSNFNTPKLLILNCTCQAEIDAAVVALGSDLQPRCFVRASGSRSCRTQLHACPGHPNGIEQQCLPQPYS